MENLRKYRKIKLYAKYKRRTLLVSKPNYHATKWFPKKTSLIEIRKTEIVKNKLLHLGSSIMMYGFCNK